MPKQIKFNLVIDREPVRNIDDLQENFNIEDLLEVYKNGSLKRWLLVRDMAKEAAELDKIKEDADAVKVATGLCRIFKADCTEEQLKQAAYPFEFRQKFYAELKTMETLKDQRSEIIHSYHDGYDKLLDAMEANGDNYAFLKAAVNDIFLKYRGLYHMDADRFYKRFVSDYPLVILTLLANRKSDREPVFPKPFNEVFKDINTPSLLDDDVRKMSDYFIKLDQNTVHPKIEHCLKSADRTVLSRKLQKIVVIKEKDGSETRKICSGPDIPLLTLPFDYFLFSEITNADIKPRPQHVKVFSGETEGHWKDLETEGKWMIIQIKNGNFVRSLGKKEEKLSAGDVNGNFPVLEGIEYQCKSAADQLIYMGA